MAKVILMIPFSSLMYYNNQGFFHALHFFFFFSVKKVKTFKLHPKYNLNAKAKEGVKEFYDYDVALIQLMEAVQISSAAR